MDNILRLDKFVNFNPKVDFKKGKSYPFIEMANVNGIAKNVRANYYKEYLSGGGAKFDEDDILFARIEPCLDNKKICKVVEKGFGSTEFFVFRSIPEVCDQEFLFYLVKTQYIIQSALNSYSGASGRQRADLNFIKGLEIKLPNLAVQKKIASILCAYDDLIENNRERIKLLEEMAEEIYKEWFVRLRFPGCQDSKFFDKDGKEVSHDTVGALPEGWRLKKLRDCLSHYIGGGWGEESPKGKNIAPAHVIRGTDIPNFNKGQLNFDVLRFHSKSNLSSRVCQPFDIIFEVSGGTEDQSLGRTSFITKEVLNRFGDPVIAASFCKLIRVDSRVVSPFYINSLLNRLHSTNELMVFQVQSTGISNYQFEDFIDSTKVKVPNVEIQKQFDDLLSPMIDETQILGAKNQVLQETRDLLLPRLISGKLSVESINLENISSSVKANTTEV
jgi:type I restriction enzyme, S subunit